MKIGTLQKCEDVLRKLHEKMEMSGSTKLQVVSRAKKPDINPGIVKNASHSPLNTILTKLNIKNSSAPASPSPPPFQANTSSPIIIPTERLIDTAVVSSKLEDLPGYKSPSLVREDLNDKTSLSDNSELLFTRRQKSIINQSPSSDQSLFHRRVKSPLKVERDSHLNRRYSFEKDQYNNEWEELTDDETEVLHNRRIRYNTPEPVRRSVFDRLGQKVSPERELNNSISHSNFAVSSQNTTDKIPRSAALITNITNQIKEAQIKQDIESDIAVYLSESEKRTSTEIQMNKTSREKILQKPEVANISCGIRKSTPSLKAVPVRKLQDASIFGDILSNIDKKIIDQVSKVPKRKSTESRQKKDVDNSKDNLKNNGEEITEISVNNATIKTCSNVKGISDAHAGDNSEINIPIKNKVLIIDKSEVTANSLSLTTQVSENNTSNNKIKQHNPVSNKSFTPVVKNESPGIRIDDDKKIGLPKNSNIKTVVNSERLSDKYPRKKSTDSNQLDNLVRSNVIGTNKDLNNSSSAPINIVPKASEKEKNKFINIPDVKSNDPRIKKHKSPQRDGSLCVSYDGQKLTENEQQNTEQNNLVNNFIFPSLVDMDYRYIQNANMANVSPYPNPKVIPSNNNFISHTSDKQEFMGQTNKKALLLTPNFGMNTFNDSNSCINPVIQDMYHSNSYPDNNRPDFFNEYGNSRIGNNPYNYNSNDSFDPTTSNDPNIACMYKKHEFGYSAVYQSNNSRATYCSRGRGGGSDFKNNYPRGGKRWNIYRRDNSRSFDIRHKNRPEGTNWYEEQTSPNISKNNINPDSTATCEEQHKIRPKTPDSDKDFRNKSKGNVDFSSRHERRESSRKDVGEACSIIKSYKIPKIKRDSPKLEIESKVTAKSVKDEALQSGEKSHEIQCIEKSEIETVDGTINNLKEKSICKTLVETKNQTSGQSQCEVICQTNGDQNNKSVAPVNNEETALMTKLFDILTKVCDKKTTPNDDHLNVLQKLRDTIDPKKFDKIQQILDADSEPEAAEPKLLESPIVKKSKRRIKVIESDSSDEEASNKIQPFLEETIPPIADVQIKKPKRRNALEMLQHDVRDMFISEGVLTATGRRMCRVLKEDNVGANGSIKDEVKTNIINSRKCRGSKKIDYTEEIDQNSSIEEVLNKDIRSNSTPNEKLLPRILLQKIKDVEAPAVHKATRGRNTARRGGLARSISRKIGNNSEKIIESADNLVEAPQELSNKPEESPSDCNQGKKSKSGTKLNVKTSKDSSVENFNESIDIAEKSNKDVKQEDQLVTKPAAEDKVEATTPKIVKNAVKKKSYKLKKKIKKRKGAWKMGKLRGKKKIKKAPIDNAEMAAESNISKLSINCDILNNDQDYFLDGEEKYPCKLCLFVGKLITGHYVHNHPKKEVYVSRLNPEQAKAAMEDSNCSKEEIFEDNLFHFKCRFCNMTLYNEDQTALLEHLTLHTGEYRYKCNLCNYKSSKMDSLKHHFKYRHKKLLVKLIPQILYDVPNFPDCAYGYLCNYCNYAQILEKNLEKHLNDNHPELDAVISKIPLYSFVKTFAKADIKQLDTASDFNLQPTKNESKECDSIADSAKNISRQIPDVSNNFVESKTHTERDAAQAITDNKTVNKEDAAMPDKRPFLSVSETQFSKMELVTSLKSSFEPFTKKMTVTDALQNKINSLVEKNVAQDIPIKMEPILEPQENIVELSLESALPIQEQEQNIKREISVCNELEENHQQPCSEEASESNSEPNIWDEQDSNDSEHSSASAVMQNVNEVLQNIEKNGKGSGNMSNTIHRLANSLIKSPLKSSKLADSFAADQLNNKFVNSSIFDTGTSLPPSEPIILNKELIKNTKMQIGTIRASVSSENEIMYGCFERGCVYMSKNEYLFSEHIKNCHCNSKWNGMCNICNKFIELDEEPFQSSYPLIRCFQHITSVHKSDILQGGEISEPKKFLKMRRLSGDILSITKSEAENIGGKIQNSDSQPFLKIESVVSLNADFLSNSGAEESDNKLIDCSSFAHSDMTALPPIPNALNCEETERMLGRENVEEDTKPWLNNSKIVGKNISSYTPKMLLDLYKCMSKNCTYTSDDKVLFQNHLMSHTLEERKFDIPEMKADYLECSYCDKICNSIISLIGHIKNNHSCCLYQCKYCFYRCFCKIYINLHIEQTHKKIEKPNILSLEITSTDIRRWKLSSTGSNSNVLPYQCKYRGCKLITLCKNEYVKHLQSHDLTSWTCFICNQFLSNIPDLILHMKSHEINIYQCCYCIYGCDTKQIMLEHLTSLHSEMPASTFMRNSTEISQSESKFELLKFNLEANLSPHIVVVKDINEMKLNEENRVVSDNIKLPDGNEKSGKNIKPSVKELDSEDQCFDSDSDILIIDELICPESMEKLSKGSNPIAKGETNLQSTCHSNKAKDLLILGTPPTELVCTEDLSSESSKLSNEQVTENEDPLCIDEISFKDHINTSFNEKLIASNEPAVSDGFVLVDIVNSNIDGTLGNNHKSEVHIDKIQTQILTKDENELLCIKELIKDTGIDCGSLFQCIKCNITFKFSCDFKEHIMMCVKDKAFNCMYCTKKYKYVDSLIEHVKTHGIHRYGCRLCNFRSPRSNELKLHMLQQHKFSKVEIIPLQSEKAHPDIDLFTCQEEGSSLQQSSESKSNVQAQMKMNSYAPNEIDKLPRNSIYSKEVECALCPFKTKVRSNIIRHLQQHKSEQSVPEVCPVNPVPCLSSKERYFDKMTNLACSSHMHKTDSGKLSKLGAIPKEEDSVLPGYIIESQRFVCGIIGCTYLTVNEEMLRHHYLALHINETCYMCPHCPDDKKLFSGTINIEKIMSHLKLHDNRLYKCSYCNYHKSQKYIVERHIADKHPHSLNKVIVIREDNNVPSKVIKKEIKAKAWICGLCDYRAFDRPEIIKHAWEKHGMKSQFKCGLCQYRCSYKNSFTNHFAARHQGMSVNIVPVYRKIESNENLEGNGVVVEEAPIVDTTPLWSREHSGRRYIRGILLEEDSSESVPQKNPAKSRKSSNNNKSTDNTTPSPSENSGRRRRRSAVNFNDDIQDGLRNSQNFESALKKPKTQVDNEVNFNQNENDIVLIESKVENQPGTSSKNLNCENKNQEGTFFYTTIYKTESAVDFEKVCNDDVISLSSSDEDDLTVHKIQTNSVNKRISLLDEGNYGTPKDGEYVCPFCVDFFSASDLEMYGHLCNELQYVKYTCSICKNESWDNTLLKAQCEKTHPNIIGHVKSFPRDTIIENWITKAIEHQRIIIAESVGNRQDDNSLLHFDEEAVDYTGETILNKSDKSEEMYFCDLCPYSTKAIGFYERHKKKHMTKIYSCGHCLFDGFHRKKVENHIKKIHPNAKVIVTDNSSEENKMQDVSDTSKSELSTEVIEQEACDKSNIVYVCYYCPKRGSTIADIKVHWESTHKEPKVCTDGKIKKGLYEFKYKKTTEQELIEKGAKVIPKNLYVCQYCGKKGYLKVLQTHHKNSHENMEIKLEPCMEKPPAIKCNICSFIVYSESLMKKHFNLSHNALAISYTKITDDDKSPNLSTEESSKFQCSYCISSFESLSEMSHHHETLHSHKSMVLRKINVTELNEIVPRRQLFKCPTCPSTFESYNYICQHIESHVKPYICNYCPDGFSLPDTVKLHIKRVHHQGDINDFSIIANTQEILEATIAKIKVVVEDSGGKSQNEFRNKRTHDEDECIPCKIPKNELLSRDSLKSSQSHVRAVAKKSTTKLPGRKQVAKKSTSRQSVNIAYNSTKNDIANVFPVSHYNKHIKYDNSKIHTVISLGGKPMRVHIANLEAITNIYPKLVVVDLKHQKQNPSEAFM